METGVEYNKQRLHKVSYFRELLSANGEIHPSIRPLLKLSRETIEHCQKTEYALASTLHQRRHRHPGRGDRRNRPKRLVVEGRHSLGHTAQYRGHVEGTRTLPGPAAAQHACARCNAALHLLVQRIAKVSACHRPHLSSGVQRIADPDRFGRPYELLLKLVGDPPYQDEPFCSQADLTCVAEASLDARRNGLGRSASSSTMKASEPPNSMTVFLITFPASEATAESARTLPVTEAPRTRGSLMMSSVLRIRF